MTEDYNRDNGYNLVMNIWGRQRLTYDVTKGIRGLSITNLSRTLDYIITSDLPVWISDNTRCTIEMKSDCFSMNTVSV